MVSIGMAQCELGVEGGKAIAELVSVTASVTSVDLSGNDLGPVGAKALVDGGAFNASMTRLDVRVNSLGEEGKAMLRKAIEGSSGFELKL